MGRSKNRFGLSRSIPSNVKQKVRQRCLFGCVICGNLVVQYHHFDPEFTNAKEHNPDKITLLCASDHDKVTRGIYSNEKVEEYNDMPFCKSNPASTSLDQGKTRIVVLGSAILLGTGDLLTIHNRPVLSLNFRNGRVEISAQIFNSKNERILQIFRNELKISPENWDVTLVGNTFKIMDAEGNTRIHLQLLPPFGLHIKELNLDIGKFKFRTSSGGAFETIDEAGPSGLGQGIITVTPDPIRIGRYGMYFGRSRVVARHDWAARLAANNSYEDLEKLVSEIIQLPRRASH